MKQVLDELDGAVVDLALVEDSVNEKDIQIEKHETAIKSMKEELERVISTIKKLSEQRMQLEHNVSAFMYTVDVLKKL